MREYELQMAWKFALLAGKPIRTVQGEELDIVFQGYGPSSLGGPDFTFAKLRINGRLWIGSVEVHTKASHWFSHQHHQDEKYSNVILHVVWEHDRDVVSVDGELIPALQLKDYLDRAWFDTVQHSIFTAKEIPCAAHLETVPPTIRFLQLDSSLVERLERRVKEIEEVYVQTGWNWDETLYRYVARSMGQKINNACMEQVAVSLPYKLLLKHKHNLSDLEALLLGQAGLLNKVETEKEHDLQVRYHFLAYKYGLRQAFNIHMQWQYKGLRPVSFPKVKLLQLAALLHAKGRLLNWSAQTGREEPVHADPLVHAQGGAEGPVPTPVSSWYEALWINAIIPFKMAYFKISGSTLDWYPHEEYAALKAEKNQVIDKFQALGFKPRSAADTQGMLELYNNYCNYKKCLSCKIGHAILKKEGLL